MLKLKIQSLLLALIFAALVSAGTIMVLPCEGCKVANSQNRCIECEKTHTLIPESGPCSPIKNQHSNQVSGMSSWSSSTTYSSQSSTNNDNYRYEQPADQKIATFVTTNYAITIENCAKYDGSRSI